jgi:hypothetical protein
VLGPVGEGAAFADIARPRPESSSVRRQRRSARVKIKQPRSEDFSNGRGHRINARQVATVSLYPCRTGLG